MNRRLVMSAAVIASVLAAGLTVTAPAHSATPSAPRATVDASDEGLFFPVAPVRLLDTRNGNGGAYRMGAGSTITLQVAGRGGLPSQGLSAVTINLTAVNPSTSSYLTAYPSGVSRPTASSINVTRGVVRANTITVPVGVDGKVRIYNNAGSIDVVGDVTGYYANDELPYGQGAGSGVIPISMRLEDTRTWRGSLAPNETLTVDTFGGDTERAAYVNVTAVGPTANGYLKAWSGSGNPNISTVNFVKGQTAVANTTAVTVRNGSYGKAFSVKNVSSGRVHVVVDLVAEYDTSDLLDRFYPMTPTRVLDTRSGVGVSRSKLLPGNRTVVLPAGLKDRDYFYVSAVVGNATIVSPSTSNYLQLWDGGSYRPNTSTVNAGRGQVIANAAITGVNIDSGNVTVYSNAGTTDAVLDVSGVIAWDLSSDAQVRSSADAERLAGQRAEQRAKAVRSGLAAVGADR